MQHLPPSPAGPQYSPSTAAAVLLHPTPPQRSHTRLIAPPTTLKPHQPNTILLGNASSSANRINCFTTRRGEKGCIRTMQGCVWTMESTSRTPPCVLQPRTRRIGPEGFVERPINHKIRTWCDCLQPSGGQDYLFGMEGTKDGIRSINSAYLVAANLLIPLNPYADKRP